MPRISIGLPVFNGAKYLMETLASLAGQTYGDFEIVISDNASDDRTRDICLDWAARDPRIRYYRHDRNFGAARNYNRVWELSGGEFFKWAAHDDLCAPTFLERCLAELEQDPKTVLSYPRTLIIDAAGRPKKPYPDNLHLPFDRPAERFRKYLFRPAQESNAVFGLIRSSALRQTRLIGHFNSSDRVLLAELALQGKFLEIGQELFFRRDHPETSMRANPSASQIATWFNPDLRRQIVFPVWRLYGEFARCVLRTGLGAGTQAYCLIMLSKWFWWQREIWANELLNLPRTITQMISSPKPGKELR